MRIISGILKGRKILAPKDLNTRPLKDLIKESIFNILAHSNKFSMRIENSNVLDLFSGVGSFGLECLSRGSSYLTFVENYSNVLSILKKNILNLNYQKKSIIIEKDIIDNLDFSNFEKKFDIIFIDPPYKEKKISLILKSIIQSDILVKNGIIIIHRHKNENNEFPQEFKVVDEKIYGISKIIFGNCS